MMIVVRPVTAEDRRRLSKTTASLVPTDRSVKLCEIV